MEANRLPSEKLLTPKEVAAWLDVSVDWVQDHATGKEPELPLCESANYTDSDAKTWKSLLRAEHSARSHAILCLSLA